MQNATCSAKVAFNAASMHECSAFGVQRERLMSAMQLQGCSPDAMTSAFFGVLPGCEQFVLVLEFAGEVDKRALLYWGTN